MISSIVNEGIRVMLNLFIYLFFFYKKISHAQKAQKVQKAQKAYKHRKHKTHTSEQKQKRQHFYAHKNI